MRLSGTLAFVLSAALAAVGCHTSSPGHGGGGNGGNGGNGGGGSGGPPPTCTANGACQVSCSNGSTTTLTGKVYAPNGTLPLYNAIVYVPSETPAAFTDGATCDRCNGSVSGNPVVQTLTDPTGSFSLTNVPVGKDIPLVVQIGKWRRQVTVPSPAQCATTPLTAALTTLPKNRSEGDMPQMAIASGSADPFECLLHKMGIDDAEVTIPSGGGRVHFFTGGTKPGLKMTGASSEYTGLFTTQDNLMKYDVVMLPCEGTSTYTFPKTGTDPRTMLVQYLAAGGRVFSTHYSHNWLSYNNSPFNRIGNMSMPPDDLTKWPVNQNDPPQTGYIATIDKSFPKGDAFAQWLNLVQNTTAPSKPDINDTLEIIEPRNDLDTINPDLAQRWMYNANDMKVQHMTFNTPLDAPANDMGSRDYCGRVVFSDFHVSADALNKPSSGIYPGACANNELSTQERALVFMLFDLSSCVQADTSVPIT